MDPLALRSPTESTTSWTVDSYMKTYKGIETYYRYELSSLWDVTLDYQFVNNPAYNRDRGPVSVVAVRLHADF